jgi:TRAP-type C4-dicarboxylate transport system permease small subunit
LSSERATTRGGALATAGRLYNAATIILASGLMIVLVVVMGVQVFFRYVLNDSLIWAEEICRYSLILLTFLLIGAAFERGELVRFDVFTNILPERIKAPLSILIYLTMIGFLWTLVYYGYRFAALNWHFSMPAADFIGTTLFGAAGAGAISMYWLYLAIPAGCLILSGHFVLALLRILRGVLGREVDQERRGTAALDPRSGID